MEEKYYLISGKALININFRESKHWYAPGEYFECEKISEKELNKYRRFLEKELMIVEMETSKENDTSVKKTKSTKQNSLIGNLGVNDTETK